MGTAANYDDWRLERLFCSEYGCPNEAGSLVSINGGPDMPRCPLHAGLYPVGLFSGTEVVTITIKPVPVSKVITINSEWHPGILQCVL